MHFNTLLRIITTVSVIKASFLDILEVSRNKNSITGSNLFFENFIGAMKMSKNKGYAAYNTFVTSLQPLGSFNSGKDHTAPSDNIFFPLISSFNGFSFSDALTNYETIISDVETATDDLSSRVSSASKSTKSTSGQRSSNQKDIATLYDTFKDVLFETDILVNAKEQMYSARFIGYFLKRFNYFLNTVAKPKVMKKDKNNQLVNPILTQFMYVYRDNLLNVPDQYEIAYYNDQLSVYNRILTSPFYKPIVDAFIYQLIKQIDNYVGNSRGLRHQSSTITTLSFYRAVLKYMLLKSFSLASDAPDAVGSFIGNMGLAFFGVTQLYPTRPVSSNSKYIQQIAYPIDNAIVNIDALPNLLE
ncbi:hypothetical protein NUSPORA_01669 [Nucleospora cyclopteri]